MIELATVAVEQFLALALYEAGVWDRPRRSDGLAETHVVEHTAESLRVRGQIWEIDDQSLHWFWLELARSGAWGLAYDVEPRHAKRVGAVESVDDVDWRIRLEGDAVMRDGLATPIAARLR